MVFSSATSCECIFGYAIDPLGADDSILANRTIRSLYVWSASITCFCSSSITHHTPIPSPNARFFSNPIQSRFQYCINHPFPIPDCLPLRPVGTLCPIMFNLHVPLTIVCHLHLFIVTGRPARLNLTSARKHALIRYVGPLTLFHKRTPRAGQPHLLLDAPLIYVAQSS